MKENSMGSVMPVSQEVRAADSMMSPILARLSGLAVY